MSDSLSHILLPNDYPRRWTEADDYTSALNQFNLRHSRPRFEGVCRVLDRRGHFGVIRKFLMRKGEGDGTRNS